MNENKKMLGVMIDCSRNAVMKVESVKAFIDITAKMGYNTVMLYTEDTYEVSNQPFFGHQRGRYTKNELKEIDAYCVSKGVELIPCIQTLAHLNCIFKWNNVYDCVKDCDDILLAEEEKTYQLIRDMFSSVSECFSSKRIHIGMDEAHNVGLGKYLEKHGFQERFDVINRHLHKVCAIAEEYGLSPMIWSDMFCRLALGNNDYYQVGDPEEIRKKANLPENVSLVYWDYYSNEYDRYKNMIQANQAFEREVLFAGGAWTWKGFAPDNKLSIDNTVPAVKACRDCGVDQMLFTMWGDDGGECSRFGVLPALFYTAQFVLGNEDEEDIKAKFKEMIGMDMDAFMLLDKMDTATADMSEERAIGKHLLYNDPFIGLLDYNLSGKENQYYTDLLCELEQVSVSEQYQKLFAYMRALCDVLSVKSELGMRTRKAYQAQDKEGLKQLAQQDYSLVIEKMHVFHQVYQEWWMSENKPQGFEVQDLRMGGLMQRLESCKNRILSYCSGDLENIPELEEKVLCADIGITWARIVTPGVISHTV